MPLEELNCYGAGITDFSPLEGKKLVVLNLGGTTRKPDLNLIATLPLRKLRLNECPVTDLTPLKGLSLDVLEIGSANITDLSPLRGMPLGFLVCPSNPIRSYEPLKDLPALVDLFCDVSTLEDVKVLRTLPMLKTINGKSATILLDQLEKQFKLPTKEGTNGIAPVTTP